MKLVSGLYIVLMKFDCCEDPPTFTRLEYYPTVLRSFYWIAVSKLLYSEVYTFYTS
jgi:hypothetical protein